MEMRENPEAKQRRSFRLKEFDYTSSGAYFVPICTRGREMLFGEVVGDVVRLSDWGEIAANQWKRLPYRFPYLDLDVFVIMPNHLHGIIVLLDGRGTGDGERVPHDQAVVPRAPTIERFGKPVQGSIPTIIRSYKSSVTQRIKGMRGGNQVTVWQRNYYERVIRDEDELNRSREYILDNPRRWAEDRENPDSTA
jgi:putative transposase